MSYTKAQVARMNSVGPAKPFEPQLASDLARWTDWPTKPEPFDERDGPMITDADVDAAVAAERDLIVGFLRQQGFIWTADDVARNQHRR